MKNGLKSVKNSVDKDVEKQRWKKELKNSVEKQCQKNALKKASKNNLIGDQPITDH
jgi:hypothetical protein